ncbi:addiction module antidote protein, HigA family [Saccharomonospora sp. CUA-673]|uniref:HigA family addiction module antitoxin n=1 Tax=Saccharomonospora sp. CUA-673 TaxID=1904969 RepID=UPI00095EFE59|nr:HigA family addiction module antitoxin [Saccharomonospora sp. CUA-673]OLT46337.1 addiction module antidote protein, HigA family [Saccharomonospora sp. CUA-673]
MTTMPPVHPGEILKEEFLDPLGISAYRLAKEIGVDQARLSQIIAGRRSITADTGLRLSRFFNMSEGFWTGLQELYDRETARDALGDELERIHPLSA